MRRRLPRIILPILIALIAPHRVHAQSTMIVPYVPGWNMAGAPPATDLSVGEALYAYTSNGYVTPTDRHATLCQGYWLYASVPAHWLVPLAGQAPASPHSCPLHPGWNLIGNPFLTAALLPASTTAYTWTAGGYQLVDAIPLGGAVWIDADAPGSILLRSAPNTAPAVTAASPPSAPTPTYQLHVGQIIELTAREQIPFVLGVNAHFLALEASTVANETTWRYLALTPGTTSIVVTLSCYYLHPACLAPSFLVTVQILS